MIMKVCFGCLLLECILVIIRFCFGWILIQVVSFFVVVVQSHFLPILLSGILIVLE